MIIIKTVLLMTLILILVQDHKDRTVSWVLFPLVLLLSAILFISETLVELYIISVLTNLLITTLMLLGLSVYVKLKLKASFLSVIGIGDVLLFIALSFAFAPISFLTFLMFGLLFSLLIHKVLNGRNIEKTVPLAGYLSSFFALMYLAHWTGFINGIYII